MGKLVRACEASEIPPGEKFFFETDATGRILIVNVDGKFYAVDGICTHAYAELSGAFVSEDRIRCPLHLSEFDVKTGRALSPPATEPLRTYAVEVADGVVYVRMD